MSDNTVRVLSSAVVVSSLMFGKLPASKQTEILANTTGKPLLFVDSFGAFTNKKRIIDRLLAGEDVSVELEFNNIELTAEELTALKVVKPVIEKIRGAKLNGYEFVTPNATEEQRIRSCSVPSTGSGSVRNYGGYTIGCKPLKEIWDKASAWWQGGPVPNSMYVAAGGYRSRTVEFVKASGSSGYSDDRYIKIGCQNVSRAEIEHVAQTLGWEPATVG